MHLWPYCQYAHLPCFLALNYISYRLDVPVQLRLDNGGYIKIDLPPPNQEHFHISTLGIVYACWRATPPDEMDIFAVLADEDAAWHIPNQGIIGDHNWDEEEVTSMLQLHSRRIPYPNRT